MPDAFIIATIVVPALLLLVLRSSATLTFLSLCLGSVLAQVAADDTSQVLGAAVKLPSDGVKTVALILLLVPPLLTAIFMIKSTRPNHAILQFLPAFGVGAAALILSQPYLPPAASKLLLQSQVWSRVDSLSVLIVGLTAFVCLLAVWMQRPKHVSKDEHK